ncbi:glycosyltransferase [Abyssibius alkaniclasticus]|uniref:glycosyltransferase family 2 protein n=1 Tax=Abyssibius alkaniclasticus TaxID=2881234 RepID=UPI002363FED4|nr:glycosyltransferase [Abyssibius alkaniclasticus]UPH70236.1 glycosyltransferase [Abyssibius alkaniclasticus]
MTKPPILSIVMPTHNRAQYAGPAIAGILDYPSRDFELVVSDTSSDGRLTAFLAERPELRNDPRLVLIRPEGPSNLTENHNSAVAAARGTYVCIIGDDDGVSKSLFDAVNWAAKKDVGAISHRILANYAWPDFRSKLVGAGHASRLYLPRRLEPPKWRIAAADLEALLDRGLQGTHETPRCYHGLIKRQKLEQVKERTGAYFHGSSPDMSGAVSLACILERYIEIDIPLTIPGASAKSNSGRSAMNTHKGALLSESQTSSFEHSGWARGVPKFFSVETVWAHAGLTSLIALAPDQLQKFNFVHFLALCRARHPEFDAEIESATWEAADLLSQALLTFQSAVDHEKRKVRRDRYVYLAKRLLRPTAAGGRRYEGGLDDIFAAQRRLNIEMEKMSGSFEDYMRNFDLARTP